MLIYDNKMEKGSLFGMHDVNSYYNKKFIKQLRSNSDFVSIGHHRAIEFWRKNV